MIAKIGLVARPVARHRVAIMHVHFTVSWQNKCPLFRVLNKPRVRNLCVTVAARALFVAQKTSRVHLGNRPVIDRASCEQRHCHRTGFHVYSCDSSLPICIFCWSRVAYLHFLCIRCHVFSKFSRDHNKFYQ